MFELIFLIIIIAVIYNVIRSAKRTMGAFDGLIGGGGREMDALFKLLEQQVRNYQNLPPEQRRLQDAQMTAMWLQMNNQMRSIDAHHRAMYEARAGEIAGYAAQNGIDFKPPSW